MSSERHVPFSKRNDPDAQRDYLEVLHEGVPIHLQSSVWAFLSNTIKTVSELREVERALEFQIAGEDEISTDDLIGLLLESALASDTLALDLVHERLSRIPVEGSGQSDALWLKNALMDGGSAYEVVEVDGVRYGLAERVPETVRKAAETAMGDRKSGQHLKLAWTELYGRGTDPTVAYHHAVKAVEAAATPIVSPADKSPTLGKIWRTMFDSPEKFTVRLVGKNDAADSVNIVRLMAQLLFTHDHKRHGDPDETTAVAIERDEAVAAVYLAVLLVQWFETGVVARSK